MQKTKKQKEIVKKKSPKKIPKTNNAKTKSFIGKKNSKSLNAFHSANYRRRKRGLKELSFEEYSKQKTATDSAGRFHPIKQTALSKAEKIFGKEIYSKKKICLKCNSKKLLIDFSMRFNQKVILNVCKTCEQERQKKYWKD
jgi:hypothetical protein